MMKKYAIGLAVLVMSLFVITGCTSKNDEIIISSDTDVSQSSSSDDAIDEHKTVNGTVDEIKDFMFVICDEKGEYYQFSFEDKPEGLEDVQIGDEVVVTYTGTVSEIDPFQGKVISVKKQ